MTRAKEIRQLNRIARSHGLVLFVSRGTLRIKLETPILRGWFVTRRGFFECRAKKALPSDLRLPRVYIHQRRPLDGVPYVVYSAATDGSYPNPAAVPLATAEEACAWLAAYTMNEVLS